MTRPYLLGLALCLCSPAWADDDPTSDAPTEQPAESPEAGADPAAADEPADEELDSRERPDEDEMDTVTGKVLPPLPVGGESAISDEEREMLENQEYPSVVYRGAEALKADPKFVHGIREGLELVFLRDYSGARAYFDTLEGEFPGTGVSAVGQTLVWQALMLENFDFKYDKQYEVSSAAALEALEAQLEVPGNEGWEHFMLAGVVGIEAIHKMRKENYLPALQRAFAAMDHIAAAKAAVPDFPDLRLADGMYNYWRTVVTMGSKVLPDFGDHRAEGIEHMEYVEVNGIFLQAPATLSLAFTWLEERQIKKALTSCGRNYRAYPDNVINNLVLGRTYIYMRKYDAALRVFNEILEDSPDNVRVLYYQGLALHRSGQTEEAKTAFVKYLAAPYMEAYQRSAAHYRLGQVYYRLEDLDSAEEQYKAAVKIDGNRSAKNGLERVRKKRKAE